MDNQETNNILSRLCIQNEEQCEVIKKQTKIIRFQTVFFGIILIVLVLVILSLSIRLSGVLTEANNAITEIAKLTHELNTVLEETKITELLNNANELIDEGGNSLTTALEGVKAALEKIEAIDIDALNSAISSLQKIVEPLAKLFGK